ncbi:MAG: N-6 DNA methylase [Candidatus Latescibacterota bacterium]
MTDAREVFTEIRNYLAGQLVGATRDEAILGEVVKCLFAVRQVEVEGQRLEYTHEDHTCAAKLLRRVFRNVVAEYPDLFEPDEEFLLGAEDLWWTARRLHGLSLFGSGSDLLGDAFEIFVGSALRGQEGQFFTPRNAIRFLIDAVAPTSSDVVIDPACGTGGFLSLVFVRLARTVPEPAALQIYGIDKDASLVRLAKIHLALLGGNRTRVFGTDSIAVHNGLEPPDSALPPEGAYDVVLTNPPFGARIVGAKPATAARYDLAKRWRLDSRSQGYVRTDELRSRVPPQLLFLEKCVRLLRPGGRCGMVVPESLISSAQYRFAVQYLLDHCSVQLVAGMPESMFKTSGKGGTHTKTCLLVFEKKPSGGRRPRRPIFFAEAQWCGNDSRGRRIDRDDLASIQERYQRARDGGPVAQDRLGCQVAPEDLEDLSLCPRRYDPRIAGALAQLSATHDVVLLGELVAAGRIELATGDEIGKMAYGSGDIPFVRTSDLSNWEIKADPKHGVSEEVYLGLRDKQDVREGDILMVKDGTYLIGTCAMVTGHDLRMLYQSHLFKIRVRGGDDVLDPFLLLAILSSRTVQDQIRSKRVTHDIIDSLGTRVNELRLPIPRDEAHRRSVSDTVRQVIHRRMEARELARQVREAVLVAPAVS